MSSSVWPGAEIAQRDPSPKRSTQRPSGVMVGAAGKSMPENLDLPEKWLATAALAKKHCSRRNVAPALIRWRPRFNDQSSPYSKILSVFCSGWPKPASPKPRRAEAVTMRRVAKAVGITPMAIYRHYRDWAALLNALAEEGFEQLAAQLTGKRFSSSIEERLTQMGEIYLDHALQNPRLFELMFLKPREDARRYPRDFKAGGSPTANLMAEVVRGG